MSSQEGPAPPTHWGEGKEGVCGMAQPSQPGPLLWSHRKSVAPSHSSLSCALERGGRGAPPEAKSLRAPGKMAAKPQVRNSVPSRVPLARSVAFLPSLLSAANQRGLGPTT
ncbi:UNVERIFIED_CONTAM: hypothetical protein K2H54_053963 [Gekko kuhli]